MPMSGTYGLHLGAVCQYEGYFFVRHLKGNSGDPIQKLADSQATRRKVAGALLFAHKRFLLYVRAQTKKTEFEEIWKSVSKCVLDQIAN